ncbi:hypothetical protein [Falsiroseomonas sp. E2-1-a20]|uniref:hypothetical protein n=1 Tax=Falsiroseomonas sp. E2-1-a20 TaxID=3239300 RepID=UPI003F3B7294
MATNQIRVFNLARPTREVIKTLIHELAHHVDWAQRRTTDHSRRFFTVYKHLIETAHKIGAIDLSAGFDCVTTRDIVQMEKLLGPLRVGARVTRPSWIVRVGEGFGVRDGLKAQRFIYSSTERAWVREAPGGEAEAKEIAAEAERLGGRQVTCVPLETREIESIYFVVVPRAPATATAALKGLGMSWREGVGWFRRLPAREAVTLRDRLVSMGVGAARTVGKLPEPTQKAADRPAAGVMHYRRAPPVWRPFTLKRPPR